MTTSFIGKAINRKQQRVLILKIACIVMSVFLFLYILLHVVNVFMLKYSVGRVLSGMKDDNIDVKYQLSSNILSGEVVVHQLGFSMQGGGAGCERVVVKKTSGILVPSEVNIAINGIWTTALQNKKIYHIKQSGNEKGFFVRIAGGIISRPSFAGIRLSSPGMYTMMDGEKNSGEIRIDEFTTILNGSAKETKYKGSMIFYDKAFMSHVLLLDTPFRWEVHLKEFKEKGYIGLNKTDMVDITNVKIEKFFMDFDFSKLSVHGTLNYATKLNNIDIEVNVTNDRQFIDNIFNLVLAKYGDGMKHIKKMHAAVKHVISEIKNNSPKSDKNNLQLFIKKTDIMPDYVINDISLTDLVVKIVSLMN